MARTKCSVHDSVCVQDVMMTESKLGTVFPPLRYGIALYPAFMFYEFTDPSEVVTHFESEIVLESRGNLLNDDLMKKNLNRLKHEFGYNTISISIDEFYSVHRSPEGAIYTFTERPMLRAFRASDWAWDELALSAGSGCNEWAPQGINHFFANNPDARIYALYIDEPSRDENSTLDPDGISRTNAGRCFENNYTSEYPGTGNRLETLGAIAKYYRTKFIIGDYIAGWVNPIYDIGYVPVKVDVNYADGLMYTGYTYWRFFFENPKYGLPIKNWQYMADVCRDNGKEFGIWINNSCNNEYYSANQLIHRVIGPDPDSGYFDPLINPHFKMVPCQKSYYDDLFMWAKRIVVNQLFLYTGDLPQEMLYSVAKSLYFLVVEGWHFFDEPELALDIVQEVADYLITHDLTLRASGADLMYTCPLFRAYVKAVFWRRLEQIKSAALKQKILEYKKIAVPSGKKRYCVNGPILKSVGQVDVIDCSRCTEWMVSRTKPSRVKFCPDGIYSDPTGGGKVTPPNPFNPPKKSYTPPVASTLSGGISSSKSGIHPTISPSTLAKTVPVTSVSAIAGATATGANSIDGTDKGDSGGDNYVPISQRQYIVRYLIR